MIADMISNKKLSPILTKLFIRGRKLNISIAFFTKSYFQVPKNVRIKLHSFFISKFPNAGDLQQIAFNHLSNTDFEDFVNLYEKDTAKPCSFLVIDTTLAWDNLLHTRCNLFKKDMKPNHDNWLEMKNCNIILTKNLQKYQHNS